GGDPDVELLVIDADATLVTAQSDHKEGPAGTDKHTFGFAPLLAYLDRGAAPGEPLAGILRPGTAPAGAASDLVELVDSPWPSSPPPTGRCWCEATAPAPAASSPGTYASRRRVLGGHADRRPRPRGDPGPAWGCLDPGRRRGR